MIVLLEWRNLVRCRERSLSSIAQTDVADIHQDSCNVAAVLAVTDGSGVKVLKVRNTGQEYVGKIMSKESFLEKAREGELQ